MSLASAIPARPTRLQTKRSTDGRWATDNQFAAGRRLQRVGALIKSKRIQELLRIL